mgnify:CR=1 FL=1
MEKIFDIDEILKSVDAIVADNKYKTSDKNTEMLINPITEKIIVDAEKSLKLNLSETLILKEEFSEPLILKKIHS